MVILGNFPNRQGIRGDYNSQLLSINDLKEAVNLFNQKRFPISFEKFQSLPKI